MSPNPLRYRTKPTPQGGIAASILLGYISLLSFCLEERTIPLAIGYSLVLQ